MVAVSTLGHALLLALPLARGLLTPTFRSSETGSWPWVHSLGILRRGHNVLKNSELSEWQPPMLFVSERSGNVRPVSESLTKQLSWDKTFY